jgi:DNA-binding transcriptional regulator of glucitol operon
MMTPLQGIVAAQVNPQTITKSKFEQSTEHKTHRAKSVNAENLTFQRLTDVTKAILHHAFWLAEQKDQLSLRDYKKLLLEQGWEGEEKKYLKIAAAFAKFSPHDIAQVEPRTIYQLAENSKKYQQVINQLLDLSVINQENVRGLLKKQRTRKTARYEKPSIWRRTKNAGRYCQIPPIHEANEQTGTTLQRMMDEEGLSAQHIVAEAIALRQAYKAGQLVRTEDKN